MSDKLDLRRIATEQRNPRTAHIDELPTIEMVRLINSEDKKVAEAVELVGLSLETHETEVLNRLTQIDTHYSRSAVDGTIREVSGILVDNSVLEQSICPCSFRIIAVSLCNESDAARVTSTVVVALRELEEELLDWLVAEVHLCPVVFTVHIT